MPKLENSNENTEKQSKAGWKLRYFIKPKLIDFSDIPGMIGILHALKVM